MHTVSLDVSPGYRHWVGREVLTPTPYATKGPLMVYASSVKVAP